MLGTKRFILCNLRTDEFGASQTKASKRVTNTHSKAAGRKKGVDARLGGG
jgi:hypothetical protein